MDSYSFSPTRDHSLPPKEVIQSPALCTSFLHILSFYSSFLWKESNNTKKIKGKKNTYAIMLFIAKVKRPRVDGNDNCRLFNNKDKDYKNNEEKTSENTSSAYWSHFLKTSILKGEASQGNTPTAVGSQVSTEAEKKWHSCSSRSRSYKISSICRSDSNSVRKSPEQHRLQLQLQYP